MAGNLLFEMLSAPARAAIFRSMAPLAVGAGEAIIRQGDAGADATHFYVLERGACDVLVAAGGEAPQRVHTYAPGRRGRRPAARRRAPVPASRVRARAA